MAFEYLNNTGLDETREGYLNKLTENGLSVRGETVPVSAALGRITYEPVYAHICAPHYHACAMDGIALDAHVTAGAGETSPVTLSRDMFIEVDTGDPLPDGCDAVVMTEDVIDAGEQGIRLYSAAVPWQNIRQIGEDICAGEMLLPGRTKVTPSAMGAMLAAGVTEISVAAKPVIGIIPTGDEIIPPCADPKEGEIIEFNSTIFSGMIEEWGASAVIYGIVRDVPELMEKALKRAISECDAVLLCAGSSAGRDDYAARIISGAAELFCHGIAIKPGKPAILACCGRKPIIGVPGYPVSGIIVIEQILKPVIERMTGAAPLIEETAEAALSRNLVSSLKYREFVRVRLGRVEDRLIATPLGRGSGVVTSFMRADGMIDVPRFSEGYAAGATVHVRLMRRLSEIERALVVTGSHDPLIDELGDMMKRRPGGCSINSSHVGSMGGIMAVKRRECHAAGIHLLDDNGEYNISYLKKHFPNGGVRLVECVYRSQGIMVGKGNPKSIKSIADIARPDIRYVNRQKGSGTRILCDSLCAREGVDTSRVYGYDREEFTHTAVAALIAAGSADAGMGIYSAAKIYGLDLIPVCEEQYDILIPDYAWGSELTEALLELLRSGEFAARLCEMGGYRVDTPGRVRIKL